MNAVLYESENITLDPLEKEFDQVTVIVGNLHTRVSYFQSQLSEIVREHHTRPPGEGV